MTQSALLIIVSALAPKYGPNIPSLHVNDTQESASFCVENVYMNLALSAFQDCATKNVPIPRGRIVLCISKLLLLNAWK